jgi:cytidine deaminase
MRDDLMQKLLKEARDALKMAIAPYSRFRVGVAIVTKRGRIYRGCNIENPSLMLSVCAEQVALTKALSEGERRFDAIAIASDKGRYCYPCGSCRQVLWEFAGDIDVFLIGKDGIKRYRVSELLPYPFDKE